MAKMIKVFLSEEEKEAVKRYAAMDGRSLSNLCRKALLEKLRRDKKRDEGGSYQVSRENLIERVCEYSQRVKTDEW